MRKCLRNLIYGTAIAIAGAGLGIDVANNGPINQYTGQKRLEALASAYHHQKPAQYNHQLDPRNPLKLLNRVIGGQRLALTQLVTVVTNKKKYFRERKILHFEDLEGKGSGYLAPIVSERTTESGTKVYLTKSHTKDFPYWVRTIEGHRDNNDPATIFKDLDGKYAILVDLYPVEWTRNRLEDEWESKIEANHKKFVNGDKDWDSAIEALRISYIDFPRSKTEEKAQSVGLEGTIAHEEQHVKDRQAGLYDKFPQWEIEQRAHLKGLMKSPAKLFNILSYSSNENFKNMGEQNNYILSHKILEGIYRINGVKNIREFYTKISKTENPSAEIKKSAELLWNIKYSKKE